MCCKINFGGGIVMIRSVVVIPYGKEIPTFMVNAFDNGHALKQVEDIFEFVKEDNSFQISTSSVYVLEALDIMNLKYKNIKFWLYQGKENNNHLEIKDLSILYQELTGKVFDLLDKKKADVYFEEVN